MMAAPHQTTWSRLLTGADLPAAIALQRLVESDLPTGFVCGKDESELASYLGGVVGVAYGVFSGESLLSIACCGCRRGNFR